MTQLCLSASCDDAVVLHSQRKQGGLTLALDRDVVLECPLTPPELGFIVVQTLLANSSFAEDGGSLISQPKDRQTNAG